VLQTSQASMPTYADVWRMLTYAVCWRMLTYAACRWSCLGSCRPCPSSSLALLALLVQKYLLPSTKVLILTVNARADDVLWSDVCWRMTYAGVYWRMPHADDVLWADVGHALPPHVPRYSYIHVLHTRTTSYINSSSSCPSVLLHTNLL
jgi:hypothetical protein